MHTGYSQPLGPASTGTVHYKRAPNDPFLVRHNGPNRAQRRKLEALKRAGKIDDVVALLNVIVHRFGLAGNGDRSRLVRP